MTESIISNIWLSVWSKSFEKSSIENDTPNCLEIDPTFELNIWVPNIFLFLSYLLSESFNFSRFSDSFGTIAIDLRAPIYRFIK